MNVKELEGKKKYAQDLQKVADEPAMGQNDIDELNKRVRHRYIFTSQIKFFSDKSHLSIRVKVKICFVTQKTPHNSGDTLRFISIVALYYGKK